MDSSVFFGISTVAYIVAMMTYITYAAVKKEGLGLAATTVTIIGFVSQSIALLVRWKEFYAMNVMLGHGGGVLSRLFRAAPLTNLYESLIFFVWCLILGYLIIEFKFKNRSFGAFVTPVAGLVLAFIEMSGVSKEISPLVPALQSNWLLVHVLMSFIAYAAFAIAFSTAAMYLMVSTERTARPKSFWAAFLAVLVLLGVTTADPGLIAAWILNFALIAAIDVKLNIEIAGRLLKKKAEGASDAGRRTLTALSTGALSLFTFAAIFVMIQMIRFQLLQVDKIRQMKGGESEVAAAFTGNVMGVVGILLFVGLVLIKYLILKKEFYLFWTMTLGAFIVVLAAMGLDFLKFKVVGAAAESKGLVFKATFMSDLPVVSILSFAVAIAVMYAIWRYGGIFKRVIQAFNISSETLDFITYKAIAVGFPIFTLGGLIFGAIWADQAWGVYWSWDPKETWSLITWLVYAFYLHARLLRGWRGQKISVVSAVGFFAVIFTYLGVNLLLSGLHAYGSQ